MERLRKRWMSSDKFCRIIMHIKLLKELLLLKANLPPNNSNPNLLQSRTFQPLTDLTIQTLDSVLESLRLKEVMLKVLLTQLTTTDPMMKTLTNPITPNSNASSNSKRKSKSKSLRLSQVQA